jgi:hypothetical protein
MGTFNNPKWWSTEHQSAWDRIKAAFRRDWEQTKADVSDKGHELRQGVGDTVKQAAGKEPIPPGNVPNPPDFDELEPALRYGYGARSQYGDKEDWNDRVEGKLREEWSDLKSGKTWDEMKTAVRRGWDHAKTKTRDITH